MMPPSRPFVYALLALVMLIWAGNSIVARAAHMMIPPFSLAFGRWIGASAILLPFAWRKIAADWPLVRQHWRSILLLGVIGVGLFNAFLYTGLHYTTASNGLLIQAMLPALVLAFDALIFRTRPGRAQMAGVAIAAAGVVVIVFRADPATLLALRFGPGDALILCGVAAWSLYTALLRLAPPIHPLSFLSLTFLIGAGMMLPPAISEWRHFTIHFTPAVIASFAYVAILPSLVAYRLFNMAVRVIGAGAAGQMISLQPLFGALLAALLLGEPLYGYHLTGMALILLGIVVPLVIPRPRL